MFLIFNLSVITDVLFSNRKGINHTDLSEIQDLCVSRNLFNGY